MKIGNIIELEIVDFSHDGQGVGKSDSLAVFVEGALIGDVIKAEVTQLKKNFAVGKLVEIVKPSENRVEDYEAFAEYGGYSLVNYAYDAQLAYKTELIGKNLQRFAGVEVDVKPIVGMEDFKNYRNNIQLSVDGKTIGYKKKGTNEVVELEGILIEPVDTLNIINVLKKSKALKRIVTIGLRTNHAGENMLILVTKKSDKLDLSDVIEELSEYVSVIYQNVNANPRFHYGKEYIKIYGEDFYEELNGRKFLLSPTSFFQVNREQTEKIYDQVMSALDLKDTDNVLDLYCGVGTMSIIASEEANRVLGVEISKGAIEDAKSNAAINFVENARFKSGDAGIVMEKLPPRVKYNKVIMDPPRSGVDTRVIEALLELKPEKIAYVSCNPTTLARDIKLLLGEYKIESVQPYDMFPHTSHVEALTLLVRR